LTKFSGLCQALHHFNPEFNEVRCKVVCAFVTIKTAAFAVLLLVLLILYALVLIGMRRRLLSQE
jgi:hypothetical protein